jgi:hypothetical protein
MRFKNIFQYFILFVIKRKHIIFQTLIVEELNCKVRSKGEGLGFCLKEKPCEKEKN